MKLNMSKEKFIASFDTCYPKYFSLAGLHAIYDYFQSTEHSMEELDFLDICSAYTEFDSLNDFQAYYGQEFTCMEDIIKDTVVIPTEGPAFIVKDF